MLTNEQILKIAIEQSAIDYNCSADDFFKNNISCSEYHIKSPKINFLNYTSMLKYNQQNVKNKIYKNTNIREI